MASSTLECLRGFQTLLCVALNLPFLNRNMFHFLMGNGSEENLYL